MGVVRIQLVMVNDTDFSPLNDDCCVAKPMETGEVNVTNEASITTMNDKENVVNETGLNNSYEAIASLTINWN